jgi:pyruvate,water dikinase
LGRADVETVGGKNSSLGEMLRSLGALGVSVPDGYATTVHAYRDFLREDGLDQRIANTLKGLDVEDLPALARAGAEIRRAILNAPLPPRLNEEVVAAWRELDAGHGITVAVRSSATAEDLPDASFAGQQATYLNVSGERDVVQAVHDVYASLFTDRAIAYRAHNKFDHALVGISVGIQRMVRSDLGASGVMFTLDTDSGFRDVVFITSAYGLGETVVQGAVNPDEFYVYKPALAAGRKAVLRRNLGAKAIKMIYAERGAAERVATVEVPAEQRQRFSLTDTELEQLARQAVSIERHYGCPMDIEWAKDGNTGQLFIVQARPETVQSQNRRTLQRFSLRGKSKVLAEGRSIGQKIAAGRARFVASAADIERVRS